jgi:nuclear transcription Y subunit beta
MDNSESQDGSLGDAFLTGTGQYIVHAEDGDDSIGAVGDSDDGSSCGSKDNPPLREQVREQDRYLPIANVARIMKKSIPRTGKIAKDARECVQECVSEFISFITSEASDRCHQEKRKTINGEDILFAMSTLGFDNYVEPLKLYLQKYREATKGDKTLNPGQVDASLEELTDETFPGTLLATDQNGQQNVIYTSAGYPGQFFTSGEIKLQ